MQFACALVSSEASSALPYFTTLFINNTIFGEKIIEQEMCVLIFSETLSETFIVLRKIPRDTFIIVHKSSCKVHAHAHTTGQMHACARTHTNVQYLLFFHGNNDSRKHLEVTLYVHCLSWYLPYNNFVVYFVDASSIILKNSNSFLWDIVKYFELHEEGANFTLC